MADAEDTQNTLPPHPTTITDQENPDVAENSDPRPNEDTDHNGKDTAQTEAVETNAGEEKGEDERSEPGQTNNDGESEENVETIQEAGDSPPTGETDTTQPIDNELGTHPEVEGEEPGDGEGPEDGEGAAEGVEPIEGLEPAEGTGPIDGEQPLDGEEAIKEKPVELLGPQPSQTDVVVNERTLSPEQDGPPSTEQNEESVVPSSPPEAPGVPGSLDREESEFSEDGRLTNTALNMVWSFGLNRNIPVLNLSSASRKLIMYACAHTGVIYDFINNKQRLLQGHSNAITCTCVSADKKWLATGDKGDNSMVIIWDTHTSIPVQTIFEPDVNGVVAIAMTPDARYLATLSDGPKQTLAIWDWTLDGDAPICTAELKPTYGLQTFIHFNPEDLHYMVTNSESQVIFYNWEHGKMEYFAPPLTDQDFNKAVGRYSQSIFQSNSTRALTGTSIGNLVVWDSSKPLAKANSFVPVADKKALKIIRLQERGIQVLTTTDRFIVVGDTAGHVKFFDQTLKLVNWYQEFRLGPINSVSFEYVDEFNPQVHEQSQYPPDATIAGRQFVIRNFVLGTNIAVYGHVTTEGTNVQVIHKEHDAATHALASHPLQSNIAVGSYSGLLKIWDYEKKLTVVSRRFERGSHICCCTYDPKGAYLALGFANGSLRILDAITLDDELDESFRYSKDVVTHTVFSLDSQYLATADAEYTVTVYKRKAGYDVLPYAYLGRYRAHYNLIKDIMFGVQLDSNTPRLLSLGEDRVLVEYDLEKSVDELKILSSDRIEQSAVPTCMTWYPPITKENFIVTANDQLKFKQYNATTKMCRKTLLGPTYGSPLKKMCVLPTKDAMKDKRYLAYITDDKIGLHILPLDGNPHNAMALIAHPNGVSNLSVSHDGQYLFTAGGRDATLHMWQINISALEAQASLGGGGLVPFYGLLDGGRDGELFAELEDYFYYAQIRNQGINAMDIRNIEVRIPLSEVPFVMRAMGFYPSEQEIEDMLNEVKFSRYVETGQFVNTIDLGDFIKLYINHRPAFGLSPEKLLWAFDKLGLPSEIGSAVDRGDLLDILQTKGEHMTECELAEYLSTLMGFSEEGGTSELQAFDPSKAGDLIDQNLPLKINASMFSKEILGFSLFGDDAVSES